MPTDLAVTTQPTIAAPATSQPRRAFLGFLAAVPAALLLTGQSKPAEPAPPDLVLLNDFTIAGFQYYDGPARIAALSPGADLTLRAEPTNPHDVFAVEIFHGDAKLGYVPRFCNRHLSRMLQEGLRLECRAAAVAPDAAPWRAVDANIYLVRAITAPV